MPGGSLEATTGPWAQAEMQVPGPCSQEAKSEGLCAWGCRRPPQRLARVPGNPHPTAAGPSPQSGASRVPQHSLVHWSCDPVLGLYLCAGDPGNQAQGVLTSHTNPTETQGGDGGQGGHLGGGGSGGKALEAGPGATQPASSPVGALPEAGGRMGVVPVWGSAGKTARL